jgi:hypothetical protein
MPTDNGTDWEDEQPNTEEDAVKRMMKRQVILNGTGIVGDLWRMAQKCHKEIYDNGNIEEHQPMTFVRYEGEEPEVKGELFYICRDCLSKYIVEHPEKSEKFIILRGKPSKEAIEATYNWAKAENEKAHAAEQAKFEANQEKPCPICGKKLKDHSEDEWKSCAKDYAQINPDPDANKP